MFCRQEARPADQPAALANGRGKEPGPSSASAPKQSSGQSKLLTAVSALQQSGFDPLRQHRSFLLTLSFFVLS